MDEVKDRYNLVYLMFFYLSVGMLLPWNFFINVNGYWMYKFRTVNATHTTEASSTLNSLQVEFTADLAVAAMAPNVMFLVLNGLIGHRFRIYPRLLLSLMIIVALFTLTLVMVRVDTDSWQAAFFGLTIATVVILNICNGIFQGAIFGLAGMFPPKYMDSILTGQGLGGVFAAIINIVLLFVGNNEVTAAFFCFLFSVVFLVGSILAFVSMSRTKVYQYYTQMSASPSEQSPHLPDDKTHLLNADNNQSEKSSSVSVAVVLRGIWIEATTVFLIYLVTLACFPALTVLIQSSSKQKTAWSVTFFVPVCCFLVYNLGDYAGRLVSAQAWTRKPGSKLCLVAAISRAAFIPLFMLCNTVPEIRSNLPVLFPSDTIYILLMTVFAVTNGYLTSVVMVAAPRRVAANHQETAANLMAGILGLGLAAGAALSAILVKVL